MGLLGTIGGYAAHGVVKGLGYAGYVGMKGIGYCGAGLQIGAEFVGPKLYDLGSYGGSKLNQTVQFLTPKTLSAIGTAFDGLVNVTYYVAPKVGTVAYYTGASTLYVAEHAGSAAINATRITMGGIGKIKHANSTNTIIALIAAGVLANVAYHQKGAMRKIAYTAAAGLLLFA